MKRSDELMQNFDKEEIAYIKKLAKDLASYKNKPIEKIYEEIIFAQTYHPNTIKELIDIGVDITRNKNDRTKSTH